MTNKEMANFILKLRDRNEMPINEDEYYLLGDIAERLIEFSEQGEKLFTRRMSMSDMMPYDRYQLILKHDRILGCDKPEEIERPITCAFLADIQSPINPPKTEIVQKLYAQLRDFLEKKDGEECGMV